MRKIDKKLEISKIIPYGKQDISQSDIDSVISVLKSEFLTQGPQVPLFEYKISSYCDSKYAVAVNSATSALHIACLSLDLGEGDIVWTSPNSFVASANCGLYCKAQVDFVDIDAKTYNMSAVELEKKLIKAKTKDKLPKVVIPVHFAGQSCNMKKIHSLGKEYGFRIIEDASHAIGGKYLDKPIGCCQYSDITVFSFHPVKIITTAEGGLATTNDVKLAEKMNLLRSHGVSRDQNLLTKISEGGWYYQQVELGFNYRMNELQAALGLSQLKRLDEFVSIRHQLRLHYDELLKDLPITIPFQDHDCYSSLHLYPIQVCAAEKSRKQIFCELRENGIGVNVHYIPIYSQPYYQEMGFNKDDFPKSENYYNNTISLPMFHLLSNNTQDEIVKILTSILL
jgi:UDP-4-amino-4,6-dideoxy-N-acetyl-beta-L-altrosamine transaminase